MRSIGRGTTTLVTGASSGIGRAFAERIAADGGDLVLVARSADALTALADDLAQTHGIRAVAIAHDLDALGAAAALAERLHAEGLRIDALINNAGLGIHGDLATQPLASITTQVTVNVTSLTELTALLLPGMLDRRRGAVVNVASTAAFQPLPHMSVYGATKAYVLSFSRALWRETRGTGVDVVAICPGATATPFFATAGDDASFGPRRTPDGVVDRALRGLRRGRPTVIDGAANAFSSRLAAVLPERVAIAVAERAMRPSRRA
ncbi:oxidoreductase [Microbacterium sp. CSI-V]|uniref:SDR family NAD(P)-dependent oxidoreductase n=1 Tax=unclassified Microbacterium TaxID=2609290 RepID=UPI00097BF0A2|nr:MULTISPECIES: SDR family oxidoreductase [unclassified Microbacterium]MXS74587.1 SDR family oxidoreductase [Microbacterium sp. TL13]ONI63177.1 oxidoreductase [Microbacterium sp. CSI-V]